MKLSKLKQSCCSISEDFESFLLKIVLSDWQHLKDLAVKDHNRYTRNLFFKNSKFDMGSSSFIHDHGGSDCFFVLLEGELVSDNYFYEENKLTKLNEIVLERDKVYSTKESSKQDIHKIRNSSDKTAYSMHIYSKPVEKFKIFTENGEIFLQNSVSYDKVF